MLISVISLLFSGCLFTYDPPQKGIEVFNNTDSIWYVAYSFSDSLIDNYPFVLFEDVNINSNEEHIYKHNYKKHKQSPCYRLNAYSYGCIGIPGQETLLQRCDNNMLRLFFITVKCFLDYAFSYKNIENLSSVNYIQTEFAVHKRKMQKLIKQLSAIKKCEIFDRFGPYSTFVIEYVYKGNYYLLIAREPDEWGPICEVDKQLEKNCPRKRGLKILKWLSKY